MRKYYQATLAIIACTSLVILLFYRHEYNRLRYVLEVLNYFGSPTGNARANCSDGELTSLMKFYNDNSSNYGDRTSFDEPTPSWQRLTDDIYVYSAYRSNNGETRAIALARSNRSSIPVKCDIFYDNEIANEIAGKFTYKTIVWSSWDRRDFDSEKNDVHRGYEFFCNYPKVESDEYVAAVKFTIVDDNGDNEEKSIIVAVRETPRLAKNHDDVIAGLCVTPYESRALTSNEMMNFIVFHNSIGIERFIVYENGMHARFNSVIKRILPIDSLSNTKRISTYTTIPWNFPFSRVSNEIVESIVKTDCLYRTRGIIDIISTVAWNEYIILKYHRKIAKLFSDFDKTDYAADRYGVSSIDVCIDRKNYNNGGGAGGNDDETSTMSEYLAATKRINEKRSIYLYRRSKERKNALSASDLLTRNASLDLITVNRYEDKCESAKDPEIILEDVGKFSKFIKNSSLSRLFGQHPR